MKKFVALRLILLAVIIMAILSYTVVMAGNFCPECGAPCNPGDKFCSECGHKLDGSSQGQPTATSEGPPSPVPTTAPVTTTTGLVITNVNPFQGAPGDLVVLKANGIENTDPGIYKVEFNGVQAQIINVTGEAISVIVPEGASTGNYKHLYQWSTCYEFYSFFYCSRNSVIWK